jgi:hypothetical protein
MGHGGAMDGAVRMGKFCRRCACRILFPGDHITRPLYILVAMAVRPLHILVAAAMAGAMAVAHNRIKWVDDEPAA